MSEKKELADKVAFVMEEQQKILERIGQFLKGYVEKNRAGL